VARGVLVRDADDALVELAIASGAAVVAIQGGSTERLVAAIRAAGREAVVVGAQLPDGALVVTDAAAARDAQASLVLFDLRTGIVELLADVLAPELPVPAAIGREPLVLLSGMLGDDALWDGLASRIGDIAAPCALRIDLDDSVPELAAGVLAAAPPRFALAGHSLGAIVALEVQRQAPQRVTRLALIAASGRGPSEAQQAAWAAWRARTDADEFAAVAHELALATLGPGARTDADLVAANEAMAGAVRADGFRRQLAAQATRPDSGPRLGEIAVPVLVVSGELDDICPPALQDELAAGIPGAQLVRVPGAGHMIPLEAPEALAAAVRAWWDATGQ
jgi:pimeloyl-ACP methyl ester carboxylesterase